MLLPRRYAALLASLLLSSLTPVLVSAPAGAVSEREAQRQIVYTQWDGGQELRRGTLDGLRLAGGRLSISTPAAARTYDKRTYDASSWTSPWVTPGISFTELIASWSATTPGDSWVEVTVRGRDATGATSSWDVLARWTSGDAHTRRTSVSGQPDDLASVNVDTWEAPAGLTSYQLSATLLRRHGAAAAPSLDTIGAMVSRVPDSAAGTGPATSRPGVGRGVVLDVPRYSQMVHEGDYPQWNGGGEAWCSPTSTSMVLGYYDALPPAAAYAWVPSGHPDPWVDYAARMTYDRDYDGTGNWPFNTAYAAGLAGHGFVTRLRSLHEAERFIAAGIPLVASISFSPGELDGAPISSTRGHVLVIAGFTSTGDVVVNDPASPTRAGVRRTYDRAQFERAWLGGSSGTVYVIRDDAHPLPAGRQSNW